MDKVVKKKIKPKMTLKVLLLAIIIVIVIVSVVVTLNTTSHRILGKWVGDNKLEFKLNRDRTCSVVLPNMSDDSYSDENISIDYSKCDYTLNDNKIKIYLEYSISYNDATVTKKEELDLIYDKSSNTCTDNHATVIYHKAK